jgi:hypothetical protein
LEGGGAARASKARELKRSENKNCKNGFMVIG